MDLEPIQRRETISESVLTRLTEEILSGRWPAERPAPSERDLALTLQVNRNAVREALKVLQHAGLLKIEHGGKTMVLDWRSHAGMEMIGALTAAGVIPERVASSIWLMPNCFRISASLGPKFPGLISSPSRRHEARQRPQGAQPQLLRAQLD